MTMLRVLGLSILVGAAAAMLVWFGWGLIANLRAARTVQAGAESEAEQAPSRSEA